jgi:hypothetical protein
LSKKVTSGGSEGVVPASYVEVRSATLIPLSLLEPEGPCSPQVQAVCLPGQSNRKKKMAQPSGRRRSVRQRSEQNKRRKRKRPASARRGRIRSSVPEPPPPQMLSARARIKRGVVGRNVNARSVRAARRSAKTKEELRRKLGERNGRLGLRQRRLVRPSPRPTDASPSRNVHFTVPNFDFDSHLTSFSRYSP